MRPRNMQLINDVKNEIEQHYIQYGKDPTILYLAEKLGYSPAGIFKTLRIMVEDGIIDETPQGFETDKVRKMELETVGVPIMGSIPCGTPEEEEEFVDRYIRLPVSMAGRDGSYLLTASGDSMVEAGINDGDLVLIKRRIEALPGDIVVALVDGNMSTLKRLMEDRNGRRYLHPENSLYDDIFPESMEIQGVAVSVIKDLQQVA